MEQRYLMTLLVLTHYEWAKSGFGSDSDDAITKSQIFYNDNAVILLVLFKCVIKLIMSLDNAVPLILVIASLTMV